MGATELRNIQESPRRSQASRGMPGVRHEIRPRSDKQKHELALGPCDFLFSWMLSRKVDVRIQSMRRKLDDCRRGSCVVPAWASVAQPLLSLLLYHKTPELSAQNSGGVLRGMGGGYFPPGIDPSPSAHLPPACESYCNLRCMMGCTQSAAALSYALWHSTSLQREAEDLVNTAVSGRLRLCVALVASQRPRHFPRQRLQIILDLHTSHQAAGLIAMRNKAAWLHHSSL